MMNRLQKTFLPKPAEIEKKWYLVDAKDAILGRLATKVARVLMGKGKPFYTPHVECGDYVVVINARQVRVTGNKRKDKWYDHYTGYPGGRVAYNFEKLSSEKPEEIIFRAVRRMLPNNRLAARMLKHLHVYAESNHAHQAQRPAPLSRQP
jgi:large subunit ribosomal protein L13